MPTIVDRLANGRNAGRELTGRVFGRLTIVEKTGRRCANGYLIWRATCQCGKSVERPSYRYLRGLQSCGCGPTGRPRIPDNGAHVNALYSHTRGSARARGLSFTLTREQARQLFEGNCAYCGAPPVRRPTHVNLSGEYEANGIDRVDSARGYEARNVVSCCATCNIAKAQMSVAEFAAWIQRVHAHLGATGCI